MAVDTILTIRKKDLSELAPDRGVDIFRELLWAEASASGVPKTHINVPSQIYDPDGGIDALVTDSPIASKQGLFGIGLTGFQIKTGKSDLGKDGTIKGLVFKKRAKDLKPELKRCLDNGGSFVVVHFGWDGSNEKIRTIAQKIKTLLASVNRKYEKTRVEILPQNKLRGFIGQYPSLALRVNEKAGAQFLTHTEWSSSAEMKRVYVSSAEHTTHIETIRTELRRSDQPIHIHVVGEPGVGKTRLVNEATKEDDLRPLVIYSDEGGKIIGSQLLCELAREDSTFHGVLIVDECDNETRTKLWDRLHHHSPRIKLVTIYNESKEISGVPVLESPQLGKGEVSAIIQKYGVPADQASRWAEFCGGSPRVAHVVGENLKRNPADLLKNPSTVDVWNRFITGGDDPNSQKVSDRRLVLQHLALFKRFGYGQPVLEEARAISNLINKAEQRIGWAQFQVIVKELRQRKQLQGSTTLYISPKLFHIWLWVDWWKTFGDNFNIDEFSSSLPDKSKLLDWFIEMFEYAGESPEASRLVKDLLGSGGPFTALETFKVKRGALFFSALALASPEEALKCLIRTVGAASKEQLLEFTEGRREVIHSLEHIALYKELFQDAARLLLKLGEAENETWDNNASGVFRDLFSLGWGRVAPTSAPPEERIPILIEALESSLPEMRKLALNACEKALEAEHFSRFGGVDEAGLRRGPDGWQPKTYGEWWEAYKQIWQLLQEKLPTLQEDERQRTVHILLRRSRGLIRRTGLGVMIIESLEDLFTKGYASRKAVLKEVIEILHYDGKQLPPELRAKLEEFKQQLEGNDFSSQLKRYVGMDLLEDKFNEEGNEADSGDRRISELALQAAQDKDILFPELTWLVTSEAENGFKFGYQLALNDETFQLLPILIRAYKDAAEKVNLFFLSGYFRALAERNHPKWEEELDKIANDPQTRTWIPELTWRSGPLTDRAAERVLSLIQTNIVGFEHLRMFGYGSVIRNLSEDSFTKWIELLLQKHSKTATVIALDLSQFFYCRKESRYSLPEDLGLRLLTHPSLFTPSKDKAETMRDFNWSEMAKWFVKRYPARSFELAKVMLEHFSEDGTIVEDTYGSPIEVLNIIVEKFPVETWDEIKRYLGPPIDSRAFHIKHWLRGDEFARGRGNKGGILPLVPLDRLWEWVDQDVNKRAWYLTSMVPKALFREQGKVCLAREVLARYGDRKDVRNELMANFSTEGWTGPESSHLHGKKEYLLKFKEGETNRNVRRWIDEYVAIIDKEIERARIREEREDF